MPGESPDADLEYRCPRCGREVQERFYGPCALCRQELVASFETRAGGGSGPASMEQDGVGPDGVRPDGVGPAEADTGGRFEPAMHVVPNQVATKD